MDSFKQGIAGLLLALSAHHATHANTSPSARGIDITWGVRIPLRDGIGLNAIRYSPAGAVRSGVCVLTLTPYIAQGNHDFGTYFAENGYTFISVDVRGRGNSEGVFRPTIQEAPDGYDVVEWLGRQAYCANGVAMWGGSYGGYTQWATAAERPKALKTIMPVASISPYLDAYMRNNISTPYRVRWLALTGGKASQGLIHADDRFWLDKYREHFQAGRPFRELDRRSGFPSPIFQEWISHPFVDDYWRAYSPTAQEYAALDLPILTITGVYDDSQAGALSFYSEHMNRASPQARERHYLVIGPWDHAGTRRPARMVGGVDLGSQSMPDLRELARDWYRWTLADGPRPSLLQDRVTYFVIGADRWRHASSLAQVTAEQRPLYLFSRDNPTHVFRSGELQPDRRVGRRNDTYTYDPRDVSSATLEAVPGIEEFTDQRLVLANDGKHLVYHSEPFAQDTEVSGFFRFSAWLAIDQPDTDFKVAVFEITRGGASILLTTDMMRARYRSGLESPVLVEPGRVLEYDFNRFTFTSRLVRAGSRLRLVVGPVNSIFWQKNYNSGGVVADESVADARTVEVSLVHDQARPSVLWVPIGNAE